MSVGRRDWHLQHKRCCTVRLWRSWLWCNLPSDWRTVILLPLFRIRLGAYDTLTGTWTTHRRCLLAFGVADVLQDLVQCRYDCPAHVTYSGQSSPTRLKMHMAHPRTVVFCLWSQILNSWPEPLSPVSITSVGASNVNGLTRHAWSRKLLSFIDWVWSFNNYRASLVRSGPRMHRVQDARYNTKYL